MQIQSMMPRSLQTRFVLLVALAVALVMVLAFATVHWYADDIIAVAGRQYAERNAAYEKSRLVQVIARELTLSKKMASSPVLKEWVANEFDQARRARAVAELEDYREFFRSRSYFFAIRQSGSYYYNDADGGHEPDRPSYVLSQSIAKDTWFYATLDSPVDQLLNVDTDRHLGVTRVWVNTLVRDAQGRAVAVTGTGVDLSEFLATVVSSKRRGVENLLLDQEGAIQAHSDTAVIDYASIRKERTQEERSTVFGLLADAGDRQNLKILLEQIRNGDHDSGSILVHVKGERRLLGATYLPEIRWFVVSLVDPVMGTEDRSLPYWSMLTLAALIAALGVLAIRFKSQVIVRLSLLNRFAERFGAGDHSAVLPDPSSDEIGQLTRTMQAMGQKIAAHTETLEATVAARTSELQQLARTDYLTGLLNRRGMAERLDIEQRRLARKDGQIGLLLIDIDWFKLVNDNYGHEVGDKVIIMVASRIAASVRSYDLCARWGGEEFLVAIPEAADRDEITRIADKLLGAIRSQIVELPVAAHRANATTVAVTVSIGVSLGAADEPLDALILRADKSLYAAKFAGRNRVGEFAPNQSGIT